MPALPEWMLEVLPPSLERAAVDAFERTLADRDSAFLPQDVPRWVFLHWLTQQGYLLHSSNHAGITCFEPRTPHDLSPDEFSKRTSVFASSDAVWAVMYAVKDRTRVKRMLNMAVQVQHEAGWSSMRYFLSLAPHDPAVTCGKELLCRGSVYVLPNAGFELMPPYDWPGLGWVQEPQWACAQLVTPLLRVDVAPGDLPVPVRVHDAARVDALCVSEPWSFPWLEESCNTTV